MSVDALNGGPRQIWRLSRRRASIKQRWSLAVQAFDRVAACESPAFHRVKLNGRVTGGCSATCDKVVSRHGGIERDRFKQETLSSYETGHL